MNYKIIKNHNPEEGKLWQVFGVSDERFQKLMEKCAEVSIKARDKNFKKSHFLEELVNLAMDESELAMLMMYAGEFFAEVPVIIKTPNPLVQQSLKRNKTIN